MCCYNRSALAGSTASFITNPLDLVKLRVQVSRRAANAMDSAVTGSSASRNMAPSVDSALTSLNNIIKQEGFMNLFRGAGARVSILIPVAMTLFL